MNYYDKYLLDIDKVLHFPITFVVKTKDSKEKILQDFKHYISTKSHGMKVIQERYEKAIEEIITINELIKWLDVLDSDSINLLIKDIDLYYRLELNLLNKTKSQRKFQSDLPIKRQIFQGKFAFIFSKSAHQGQQGHLRCVDSQYMALKP